VFDRNGLPAWIADVLLGNDFGRDFLAPGQDGVVDLAGDVSLDAAHDFGFGSAFADAAGEVVAAGLVAA
jgi:hypothetical protein